MKTIADFIKDNGNKVKPHKESVYKHFTIVWSLCIKPTRKACFSTHIYYNIQHLLLSV